MNVKDSMKYLFSVAAVVAMAGAAEAQKQKKQSLHDQFTGQGYGTAGCGLGSVVFGDKPGMIQVFAATTNSYGGQTFAISSGTSNCGESGAEAAAQFIKVNQLALEKDVVRGSGESVASLGQILSCKNGDFAVEMKRNYSQQFPQGGADVNQLEAVAYKSCQI